MSLVTYANLEDSANDFFTGMNAQKNQSFRIISKVVTATVSNRNTSHLVEPVTLTFYHLNQVQRPTSESELMESVSKAGIRSQ